MNLIAHVRARIIFWRNLIGEIVKIGWEAGAEAAEFRKAEADKRQKEAEQRHEDQR